MSEEGEPLLNDNLNVLLKWCEMMVSDVYKEIAPAMEDYIFLVGELIILLVLTMDGDPCSNRNNSFTIKEWSFLTTGGGLLVFCTSASKSFWSDLFRTTPRCVQIDRS